MIVHLGEQPSSGGVMSVSVLFAAGQGCVLATEALDAWSVGILALELFSGRPVWNHKTCYKHKVRMLSSLFGNVPCALHLHAVHAFTHCPKQRFLHIPQIPFSACLTHPAPHTHRSPHRHVYAPSGCTTTG